MNPAPDKIRQHIIVVFIALYLFFQVAIPLRHFALPGDPDWYKIGDKFAWYLVRNFYNEVYFQIYVGSTQNQVFIDHPFYDDLVVDQIRFHTRPKNLITYAKYLKKKYASKIGSDAEVHAVYQVRLNGRPFYPYVDYSKDLTKSGVKGDQLFQWILPHPDIQAKGQRTNADKMISAQP